MIKSLTCSYQIQTDSLYANSIKEVIAGMEKDASFIILLSTEATKQAAIIMALMKSAVFVSKRYFNMVDSLASSKAAIILSA